MRMTIRNSFELCCRSVLIMESRNVILAGTVYVKKHWRHKKRYAVAYSGREAIGVETKYSEGRQAHLLIYKSNSSSSDIVENINFSMVLGVLAGSSGITLRLPDPIPDLKFRAKRTTRNKQWMNVCTLLNALPNYPIPKPPEAHRSLLRPELAALSPEYCELYNARDAWAVHVLPGCVAAAWNITGLQIVAIGKNSMLNLIHLVTGETRLKVSRHDILRCGYWNTMICLEVHVGLQDIMWINCFQDQVKQIRDKIHNFAFYGTEGILPPLPQFSSFFSDLPFSPQCFFNRSQKKKSRSTSSISQESNRSDASSQYYSQQVEKSIAPPLHLSCHPSFNKLTTPSNKHRISRTSLNMTSRGPDLVYREKNYHAKLLDLEPNIPADNRKPLEYTEPIFTKPCVTTYTKPQDYTEPITIKNSATASMWTDKHCIPTCYTSQEYITMKTPAAVYVIMEPANFSTT